MTRQVVADLRGPQPLQPKATPTDRFAPRRRTQGAQLAAALSSLGEAINSGAQTVAEGLSEEELRDRKVDARMLTRDFNRHLIDYYASSDARNSEDPDQQAAMLADAETAFFKDRQVDPKVLELARPGIDNALDNISSRLSADAVATRFERLGTRLSAEVSAISDISPELPNEEVTRQIGQALDDATALGLNRARANVIAVRSAVAHAENEGDDAILDIIENFKFPNGARLVNAETRKEIEASRGRIAAARLRDENFAWTREQRIRELTHRSAQREALRRLIDDPESDLRDLQAAAPGIASGLYALQNSAISNDRREDPGEIRQLWTAVFDGVRDSKVLLERAGQANMDARSYGRLLDVAEELDRRDVFAASPEVKHIEKSMIDALTFSELGNFDGTRSPLAADSRVTFRRVLMSWIMNQEERPSEDEIIDKALDVRDLLIRSYAEPGSVKRSTAEQQETFKQGLPAVLGTQIDEPEENFFGDIPIEE